jgi:O-antigen/teichoic acid export membrane protein
MGKPIVKLGSALVDQSAFSLANFLINIQLARMLSESDYGLFALAFTIFTLVNIILSSFLIEPMMINGSGNYSGKLTGYLRILVKDFWTKIVPVCSLVIIVIGSLYRDYQIFVLTTVLALGVGPLCFQLLIRRICYLYHRPWISAVGGLTYLLLIGLLSYLGGNCGWLTSLTGLGLMISAAILGSLVMMAFLRSAVQSSVSKIEASFAKEVRKKHLAYGRWAVITAALAWIPGNIYILLLPVFWGYEEAGQLRAVLNLILPVLQIQLAMTPLLLPWLVRQIGSPNFFSKLKKVAGLLMLLPILWTLGLTYFGGSVLDLAYEGKYQVSNLTLGLLGSTTIVSAMVLAVSASIKAHSRPDFLVLGYGLATLLCFAAGLPLMIWYGIQGVVIGMILAAVANLVVLIYQLKRLVKPSSKILQSRAL